MVGRSTESSVMEMAESIKTYENSKVHLNDSIGIIRCPQTVKHVAPANLCLPSLPKFGW